MNTKALTLVWVILSVIFCSCDKNSLKEQPTRNEFIKVYDTTPDKLLDGIDVPLEGVQDGKFHVLSNVPLQWKYLVDQTATGTDWLTIKSVEEVEPGHIVVTYDAQSLLALNSLTYRSARLSFSSPEAFLGKFLTISQGYDLIASEDFSTEEGGMLTLTGKQRFTTREFPELNMDYYDYITFNAWAETDNEFLNKNITLDVTVSGGKFYDTRLTTHRFNIPLGTSADESNFHHLLVMGSEDRMSAKTTFSFSTDNDNQVFVHVDNFAAYTVSVADMGFIYDDEVFDEAGEGDIEWE